MPQRDREDAARRQQEDRSGSNSGSDRSDGKDEDKDDDRSGSNRGSDAQPRAPLRAVIDVERDARGGDRQRDEVLLIGPEAAVPAVRQAGYTLMSERRLESLRQTLVRVRVRDGQSVEQLMESLRTLVPGARVAPNHIYNPSQQAAALAAADAARAAA